jgi:hypothetical protein
MAGPEVGRELLRWVVFIVLLAGVTLLVVEPGTPAFAISAFMFGLGVLSGGVLLIVIRLLNR